LEGSPPASKIMEPGPYLKTAFFLFGYSVNYTVKMFFAK